MELRVAKNQSDLENFFPVIHELRQNLSLSEFLEIYRHANHADGYEVVALVAAEKVMAVMGYRILYDLVHGKHLYVDDLVTTEAARSQGLGEKLLHYAESVARQMGCKGLRLCTGIENLGGKKFYEKHGWQARALAYKKKLL